MPFADEKLETLDAAGTRIVQRAKLQAMLDEILPDNAFYREKFAGIDLDAAANDWSILPLTTRDELQVDQRTHPPYGRNFSYPLSDFVRFHQTSGTGGVPMRWLDRQRDWDWWTRLWRTIYCAAGVQRDDRFIFPFSFGPFIGFWAAFDSAVAMGNLCLPAGGMTTTARLRLLLDNNVTLVGCTPTYALRMAEVAREEGIDLASSPVRGLFVAGEPGGSIPATRAAIEQGWGARVFDHAGMTETGPYAFECIEAPGGLHVNEAEFIAEVRDTSTGDIRPDGAGELVITNLGRWGSPLIRYRTGDQVRLTRDPCVCGRRSARLVGGILGRIDDMVVVRGNNVFPSAIEAILREFNDIAEFRLEVTDARGMSELRILIEPISTAEPPALVARVMDSIRDRLSFRPVIEAVAPGSLPRFEMKARRLIRRKPDDPA
ncbi:MAG TPA: phenylacetate--CoA ligase family protein [Phycisphaerae bacterium]|nr:phenylacetate--CoA ligase family protein [Phycisphaerae bacterium]HRW55841.1 phenylacetate--CoA ligase family protein [Phycisphaerae bacterium]